MLVKFRCPHCSKRLKVKQKYVGKKIKCPGCLQKTVFLESDQISEAVSDSLELVPTHIMDDINPPTAPPVPSSPFEEPFDDLLEGKIAEDSVPVAPILPNEKTHPSSSTPKS